MQGPPEQRRLHWTVLLLPAALAAFLGTWQVGRQKWKVEQVQQRETGLKVSLRAICKVILDALSFLCSVLGYSVWPARLSLGALPVGWQLH